MLRIAASSPDMWAAITSDNADEVLAALVALRGELERFERAATERDVHALRTLFAEAREW